MQFKRKEYNVSLLCVASVSNTFMQSMALNREFYSEEEILQHK